MDKKRGRPPGRKNTPKEDIVAKHITLPLDSDGKRIYKYTFTTSKCKCEFQSDFIGCGMWCKHKHLMDIITDNQPIISKG